MRSITKARMWRALHVSIVVAVLLSLLSLGPQSASYASISSCVGAIGPQTVASGSSNDFQIQLTNNDASNPIRWIEIDTPSGIFTSVNAVSAPGWTSAVGSNNYVTLTGGAINPGDTFTVTVNATAYHGSAGPTLWYTHISDDTGGAGSSLCDGDLNTQIVSNVPPPTISNITLSDLTPHSVTISWQTDTQTTGQLAYSSSSDANTLTNNTPSGLHNFNLSNLTANTAYHYQITADDGEGNVVTSSDNTFLTPVQPPAPPPPVIVNNVTNITVGVTPGVTLKAVPTEHIPPTVIIATSLNTPFKQSPVITGTAADNDAVARVEYSLDGGRDWLPVDKVTSNNGGKTVAYHFTPAALEDGDYSVAVRATDASSNISATTPVTMVIDRLPPQLGPLVVSYGPETIRPNEDGTVHLVAGADYRLAISGVGGPTSVVLEASLVGSNAATSTSTRAFALAQNPDSGLWNGLLSFKSGGVYQLVAKSIDGAGNRTERTVLNAAVMSAGRVVDAHTQSPVAGAKVTLYYLEPTTRAWQVWDGAPYSQENPQTTGGDGKYSLMVPEGKYYLKVQGPLYHSFVSDIFTVDQPRAITATVSLDAMAHIGSVHLPDIVWRSHPIQLAGTNVRAVNTGLVGAILPDFNLPTTTGSTQRGLSLTGRPTLVTILTTWSPSSQNQLAALADLQTNKDINITPVFSQEHAQLVTTYLKTAGYSLNGVIDSDGVLVQPLHISSAPQHILVDRTGTIRKVMNGVFTKDQLLNELGGL